MTSTLVYLHILLSSGEIDHSIEYYIIYLQKLDKHASSIPTTCKEAADFLFQPIKSVKAIGLRTL